MKKIEEMSINELKIAAFETLRTIERLQMQQKVIITELEKKEALTQTQPSSDVTSVNQTGGITAKEITVKQ